MCFGRDPDMVIISVLRDLASDDYLNNNRINEQARERYERAYSWCFGDQVAHIPSLGLDYLYEANLTFAYGFYRSSIFCCAAMLDLELKRSLVAAIPELSSKVESQTLGQSIALAEKHTSGTGKRDCLESLKWINNIRNKVAVHPGKSALLVNAFDDDRPIASYSREARKFFTEEEIETISEEQEKPIDQIDWFEELALKVIKTAWEIVKLGGVKFDI